MSIMATPSLILRRSLIKKFAIVLVLQWPMCTLPSLKKIGKFGNFGVSLRKLKKIKQILHILHEISNTWQPLHLYCVSFHPVSR